MSVIDLSSEDAATVAATLEKAPTKEKPPICFFCCGSLPNGPIVIWRGTHLIGLHHRCASEFAVHLCSDSLSARHIAPPDDQDRVTY